MNFGQALEEMKLGKKVARAGWNGKKMWTALTPGTVIPVAQARHGAANLLRLEKLNWTEDSSIVEHITINAHIDMRAADGTLVVGWLASQTDMIADDWSVVL